MPASKDGRPIRRIALFAAAGCTGYPGAVGDTILQSSLVQTLLRRDWFPNVERVVWWSAPPATRLFKPEDLDKRLQLATWDGVRPPDVDWMDAAIAFDVALLCTVAGAALRASLQRMTPFANSIIVSPDPPMNAQADVHLTVQLHRCLEPLGIAWTGTQVPSPRLLPSPHELEWAKAKLVDVGFGARSYSICNIAAGDPEKRWGQDQWVELIVALLHHGPVWIWHGLAVGEAAFADAIWRSALAAVDPQHAQDIRCESTELRELAALASLAAVCVCCDGGPMHVMAAAGAKLVNLVGKMNPATWRPLSETVIELGQWGRPLAELQPREVLAACGKFLK